MNYDEIVKALKEEKKLNEQLGKVGEGVDEQLLSKRRRNGCLLYTSPSPRD